MITINAAQQLILQNIVALPAEEVTLLQGLGRIVSSDIHAPWDIPGADNSAMDGYAYCHATLNGDSLEVVGFLPAGGEASIPIAAGEAVKIMTGAPVPAGCDTVVPIEETELTGTGIRLCNTSRAGNHIRKQGEDIRAGALAIAAGTLLRPQEIGMLTSFGRTTVPVIRPPRVGILATGDELMMPGTPLGKGKLYNSNSFTIAAQVLEAGGEPVMLGIASDDGETTRQMIKAGMQYDLLVTTGGVSVGDRDCVKEAITSMGGDILFWKVDMKPGKPLAYALLQGKPIFALPGNPVAAMVSFEIFTRPVLRKMLGHGGIFRPQIRAVLTEPLQNRGSRPHLVRVLVELRDGRYQVNSTGNQSSARISSLTAANGLLQIEAESSLAAGEEVSVALLDREFENGI